MDLPVTISGIKGFQGVVERTSGPNEWRDVTQADIDKFAHPSDDNRWIHVDVERAKTGGPFGTTIAGEIPTLIALRRSKTRQT